MHKKYRERKSRGLPSRRAVPELQLQNMVHASSADGYSVEDQNSGAPSFWAILCHIIPIDFLPEVCIRNIESEKLPSRRAVPKLQLQNMVHASSADGYSVEDQNSGAPSFWAILCHMIPI